jgi:DNA replication protein DnaC
MAAILRADLFVLDELGFLPLGPEDATFLFELVNKRYQMRKSTLVTSNKSFGQWAESTTPRRN